MFPSSYQRPYPYWSYFGDAAAEAKARAAGIDYGVGSQVVQVADPSGGIFRVAAIVEDTVAVGGPKALLADVTRRIRENFSEQQRFSIVKLRAVTSEDRGKQRETQLDPPAAALITPVTPAPRGLSLGANIAIGVGAVGVVGLGALLLSRRR
jgi:hypothetical protein